jgi:hypothetical protein
MIKGSIPEALRLRTEDPRGRAGQTRASSPSSPLQADRSADVRLIGRLRPLAGTVGLCADKLLRGGRSASSRRRRRYGADTITGERIVQTGVEGWECHAVEAARRRDCRTGHHGRRDDIRCHQWLPAFGGGVVLLGVVGTLPCAERGQPSKRGAARWTPGSAHR